VVGVFPGFGRGFFRRAVEVSTNLFIDFETRSTLDLPTVGLDNYARHPTTGMWCLGFAFDDSPAHVFSSSDGPFPLRIRAHITQGGAVIAHNAAFELAIWNNIMAPRYNWPKLKPEQCVCTAAMARAMGLPGALEDAAPAAGLDVRKDAAGKRLMLQMCAPREQRSDVVNYCSRHRDAAWLADKGQEVWSESAGPCPVCGDPNALRKITQLRWWDEPDKLARLYEYCKQDVVVERDLFYRLAPLSARERAVWLLDYKINQRGVPVDLPKIKAAIKVVQAETTRLNARVQKLTNNYVSRTTEVARTAEWVRAQGVDITGLAKADLLTALADADLPATVRAVLETRQEAARSSTAKLGAMLELAGPDGRVRNTKQYHGAATGRWAGRGMQTDNFPRPTLKQKDIERAIELLPDTAALDMLYAPPTAAAQRAPGVAYERPMGVVSSCLRGMIAAPHGHEFVVGDFSNIEGRVLAWLAGEEWKLQAFRDYDAGIGPDIYISTYAKSFGVPTDEIGQDDPRRQVGKVEELAFGFGGGRGAWRTMEKSYPGTPFLDDPSVEDIKDRWRAAHPAIVAFWYALENAARAAVLDDTRVHVAGSIMFHKSGSFLRCKLPSGRLMYYPYPKLIEVETPWGEMKEAVTYMTVVAQSAAKKEKIINDPFSAGRWQRVSTYGGKLAENVTQAAARDLLADAMLRCDAAGLPIVMHVHDEIVAETSTDVYAGRGTQELEAVMVRMPKWATGLPVAVKTWFGKRYRK
jgi:DNA polymerase